MKSATVDYKNQLTRNRAVQIAAWSLSLTVAVLAFIAWGQDYGWQLGHLTTYMLFPLLGLVAYSVMWSHYMAGTLSSLLHAQKHALAKYYTATGWLVLILICLHPGLLIFQRFRDGYGLPPGSYESYVSPGLGWITLLGTVSLLVFFAYEFHRWYNDRGWWHFVQEAGDVAMLAIFYHGLRIGSQLSGHNWFTVVWWFYGLSLIAVLVRSYYRKYFQARIEKRPAV